MKREERQAELNKEAINIIENASLGEKYMKIYLCGTWCNECKYYHGNESCSCDAYPNGIPDKFAIRYAGELAKKHTSIESNQIGSFVYKSIKDS